MPWCNWSRAEAMDTELAGQFALIGIVEDEKFASDERLRRILDEAVITRQRRFPDDRDGAHPTEGFRYYDGDAFDGAKTYRPRLPKDIPAVRFWPLTLYDNQTRSMLDTPQRFLPPGR